MDAEMDHQTELSDDEHVPSPTVPFYLGMGGNIGDVREAFARSLRLLDRGVSGPLRVSRLYRTAPWGKIDQPEYLNLVAEVPWNLDPQALLGWTRRLEREAGRVRAAETRWGPRPLDIDLIIAGDIVRSGALLTIPHPRLHERNFVLLPLRDLLPGDYVVPARDGATLDQLIERCEDESEIEALSDGPWEQWRT